MAFIERVAVVGRAAAAAYTLAKHSHYAVPGWMVDFELIGPPGRHGRFVLSVSKEDDGGAGDGVYFHWYIRGQYMHTEGRGEPSAWVLARGDESTREEALAAGVKAANTVDLRGVERRLELAAAEW
jgi:hypothetical protein